MKRRPLTRGAIRPDRKDLSRFVSGLPAARSTLGLTHVTTGYVLREILESGKIATDEKCHIFGERLTYAFYGRSAFRRKGDDVPADLTFLFPVVLVLNPMKVPTPKYVFGFDTGAFVNGYMNDYLDPDMPLFDFQLEPHIQSVARLIEALFGDVDAFLRNQPLYIVDIPHDNFEAQSYGKMVRAAGRGSNKLDDRASTPEVIFDVGIDIKDCVCAAILPDAIANSAIGSRLENLGIRVDAYEWAGATRPSEYHMLIRNMVRAVYRDFGWA